MFIRNSAARVLAPVLAGVLQCATLAYGESGMGQSNQDASKITVSMDGLTCSEPTQGSFEALDFHIDVTTTSGTGGAGAGKTVFGDLQIQKRTDTCSLPLFILGAGGLRVKQVVLSEVNKANKPILTMTLENVQIVGAQLKGSEANASGGENLDLSYTNVTIVDGSGHTTGRITR